MQIDRLGAAGCRGSPVHVREWRIDVLKPRREPGSRCGAFDFDSVPPARTMSLWPDATCAAAWAMAVSPGRRSLLMVVAGTSSGMPPAAAPRLAGFGPRPAWITYP